MGVEFVVGVEIIRIVADHAAKIGHDMGRKCVLVGGDPHRLEVVRGLALARGLLHLFVRNIVARELMADDKAKAIVGRQVALDSGPKNRPACRCSSSFAEPRDSDSGPSCCRWRCAPNVFLPQTYCPFRERAGRVKAAAGKHHLAVETWL